MSSHVRARLLCAALLLALTVPTHAEPLTIDLPTALARARERAPEAIAALARIGEAHAHGVGAGVRFAQNPQVQVGAGARFGEPRTLAIRGSAVQLLEPGRRDARIAVAEAEMNRAKVLTEVDLRKLSIAVANAYYAARFTELEIALERRNLEVVTRAAQAAERRRKAGELTDLDLNLARVALGRARSELASVQADHATSIGQLALLIGARPEDTIALAGDLRPAPITLDELRKGVAGRPDVRARDAEARVARAEAGLAKAIGRPDVGLVIAYELDTSDSIILGGLTVTLPFWNRAQGDKAAARAKLRNAELERAAVAGAAAREIVDAFDAYTRVREAVDIFEREVMPPLDDSAQLLDRSIETGQIAIADYILAHEAILAARHEHLERQLQLAKMAALARYTAGLNP